MLSLKNLWMAEPVAIATAIRAIVLAAMAFGMNVTPAQLAAVMLAVESVLMLFTRSSVHTESAVDVAVTKAVRSVGSVITVFLIGLTMSAIVVGCAPAPRPNLSPAAAIAWNQHEIQKDLDLIRDLAQDGNAQTPPVVSTDDARIVTRWHQSAITIVHDAASGWKAALTTGLDQLKLDLSAGARARFGPYIDLAINVVKGFPS